MFGRCPVPCDNGAPLEPFELFVQALVRQVNRLSKNPLADKEALPAFEALKETQTLVFNDAHFLRTGQRSSPADCEMRRLAVAGFTDPCSEASRPRWKEALRLNEPVTESVSEHSLRRLRDAHGVLRTEYGDYRVPDDAFAEWVRNRALKGRFYRGRIPRPHARGQSARSKAAGAAGRATRLLLAAAAPRNHGPHSVATQRRLGLTPLPVDLKRARTRIAGTAQFVSPRPHRYSGSVSHHALCASTHLLRGPHQRDNPASPRSHPPTGLHSPCV